MKNRLLLITGAGRSGTKYTANLLRRAGLDVGHEQVKKDGTVSGPFVVYQHEGAAVAFSDFQPYSHVDGERACDYEFEFVWHQTRDPLKAIGSIRDVLNTQVRRWAEAALGQPMGKGLPWAMNHWYITNKMAASISSYRFKVEDVPELYQHFRKKLGLTKEECPDVSNKMNRSSRTRMRFKPAKEIYDNISYPTWKELAAIDARLTKRIYKLATKYGYSYKEQFHV